jgi:periplasmic divalent cation tolerance protein
MASPDHPADFVVVLMTAPDAEVAGRIANTLVDEKLVACVNILSGLRSIYRWENKLCDESEVLCLMKTRLNLFPALRDRIATLHPYQVPEIIALPLAAGSALYLAWVRQSTSQPDGRNQKDRSGHAKGRHAGRGPRERGR